MKKRLAIKVVCRVHTGARYSLHTMQAAAKRLGVELVPYNLHQTLLYKDGTRKVSNTLHYYFGMPPELGLPMAVGELQEAWWLPNRVVENTTVAL